MSTSKVMWLHAAAILTLATQALAQQCYYPNGNTAPEKPCSSAPGSACCPDKWQCLDNGLCYYPADKIYGRYSCTDKEWKSSGCPSNLCTYDKSAAGGEAVVQCSNHNNQWCCNADRIHVDCCQESPAPRPFFNLQDGKAYATVGQNQASKVPNLATITGLASGSGSSNSPTKTSAQASSAASTMDGTKPPSVSPSSASPITSIQKSVSSGPGGVATIERTILVTPPPTSTAAGAAGSGSSSNGDSGPNIGLIVGCAVGIPMALALAGIVFWMLRKRRQQKTNPYKNSSEMEDGPNSPGFAGGAAASLGKKETYRHSRPGTTEIDSHPAGPERPVSNIPGHAELDSGAGFQPGHGTAYSPNTVGIGGGHGDGRSTWGSAPPGYSPNANQTAFNGASELDDTSVLPVINEKTTAQPQQYQAYRPPAAELPSVKTPPEDVEKQIQR